MVRPLLAIVTAAAGLAACAAHPEAPPRPPNVVVIMIDDLGWMDLGCQGNPRVSTPHVDALAAQGMRFTDAYAPAPVCSPSRAAILTGMSPARLRITNHLPDQERFTPADAVLAPAPMLDHLPLEHVTFAERVRDAGYATAFIGKWHLCGAWTPRDGGVGDARYHPEHQGFDVNIGGCARGGPTTFFDPYNIHAVPSRRPGEYLPDRLADEAIAFMRRERAEPFLLCLWNYTVHWPMEAPQAVLDRYAAQSKGPGFKDHRYVAMIEAMDAAIGRVLAALDELGLADDTLVVFTSDNGGYGGVADNRPLRADKGHLYEGGIRVPLIVRWPGHVAPGSVCAEPVIGTDLFATVLAAAGLPPSTPGQPADGESLVPLLEGRGAPQREALYFHYPNYAFHRGNRLGSAIRMGRYKLIENFDDGSVELYDLDADIGERHDVAAEHPGLAIELRERLREWRREVGAAMPEPRR